MICLTHREMLIVLFYSLYGVQSTFVMQLYEVIPGLYATSGQLFCKLLGKPAGCMLDMF
jgi:hypothetical protein